MDVLVEQLHLITEKNYIMNKIDKKINYEGYLWMSDSSTPILLNNEIIKLDLDSLNPFLIEGQLYDKVNNKSYSIKYIDGESIVKEFNINQLEKEFGRPTLQRFASNRMGNKQLNFSQYWKTQPDELCDGMEIQKPAAIVFTGFKKEEK